MAGPVNIGGILYEDLGNGQMKVVGYADAQQSAGRVFSLPPNPRDVRQEQRQNEADRRAAAADARSAAAEARAAADFASKNTMVPPPGDNTKTGEDYLATLDPSMAGQVKALADGRRAFPTGAALRSPSVQELVAAATQYDPTLDAANAATRVATRKKFTSGTVRDNITAINTALGHLGTLYKDSNNLENRSLPIWNTVANAAESQTGDPRVSNFNMTKHAVVDELEKAFRGSGGTQAGIEEWSKSINSSQSPEQLHGAITKGIELLNSRLEALGQAYEQGMGKSADPLEFLNPHAKAVFQALGPGGSGEVPDLPKDFGGTPPILGGSDQPPSPPAGGGDSQTSAASGATRTSYDARTSSQIDAMINAGASKGMIDAVLKRQNFPVVSPGEWTAIQGWRMKNPGKKYYGANISRTEDLNLGQRIAGSAPAAGFAHGVNAATAGTLGAISGEQGQGALDAMAALHPDASVTGDVAGGVIGAMGAEGAIAARAPAALAQYAPRIADALYGGALGFNTAKDGQGLTGAVEGAGAGLLGGILGQKAMSGAGRVFRGVTDPAVQYLRGQGVPMTVGQVVGNSGLLGRSIKGAEDALTSVPGVGNIIDARRMEGMQGFNRAAFNAGGAPIGAPIDEIGANGVQLLDAAKSKAYGDALDHVTIDAANDPNLVPDMTAAALQARTVPQVGNDAADALTYRFDGGIDNQGLMSGRDFQEAYRGLGRDGRAAANGSYAHEVAGTMREGQDILAQALEGQNPGAFQKFVNANQANRNLNVLADAVNQAKGTGGVFTPHQLNMKDAQSALRLTGNIASASGNRPFADLAAAGQQVLPSKLGDSGTFKRMLVGGLATGALGTGGAVLDGGEGAAGGTGMGLGTMLLLAAGGSKPAQRIMTKMLTDRPDRFVRAGDYLVNKSGIGGWTGAGALTPLLIGQ
jgi:hypothetical protein